ncbi:hypothetical protein J6590_049856 [Homalodisca vitripennis]|nr:hypothetical protein J6590_049856 [Homalodisca vitripennis]
MPIKPLSPAELRIAAGVVFIMMMAVVMTTMFFTRDKENADSTLNSPHSATGAATTNSGKKNAPELNQNSGFANYQLYEPRVILKHSHSGDKQEEKVELREVSEKKKTDETSDDQKQMKPKTQVQ